jgi:5-methylcytosine-specific restriction endonuclease McrA
MKKTPLKRETPLKSRTLLKVRKKYINAISPKRAKISKQESKLRQELLIESNGLCQNCGQLPDWRGLSKHEKVFRSHGGSPIDKDNIILICAKCHSEFHGIKEK